MKSADRFNSNLFPLGQFRFLELGDKLEVGDLVMYKDGKISHQIDPDVPLIPYDDGMLPILRRKAK